MSVSRAYAGQEARLSRLLSVQNALAIFGLWLERIVLAICIALIATIFFSVFMGVVIRYVVNVPWPWTEEVARFCLVWFALLAASIGARRGIHFSFQWGVMPLSEGLRRRVRLATNLLAVAFLSMLLWLTLSLIEIMNHQTAMATEIDMRIPAAGIVVGVAMLLVVHVLEVLDGLLSFATGERFSLRERQEEENFRLLNPSTSPELPATGAPIAARDQL